MPRTELIWDGKYDAAGKRVAPLRAALPFQTVETVNESSGERKSLSSALERDKPWRNRLIWGVRNGRFVHVGGVDGPVTDGDVRQIAAEFKRAVGSGKNAPTTNGVDVLGWDFAFELHEMAKQQAEAANIRLNFKRIPRDVMDKRAVEAGEISFFELAALDVTCSRPLRGRPGSKTPATAPPATASGYPVTLTLSGFVIPPDDVPEEVRGQVTHWSQWIDFWAVDWNHHGDTFHNEWQTFRTRKKTKLELSTTHAYEEPGEYKVLVKVIDILGNDTTKTVKVTVK
jgi:adenine-specific DNA-methyltransferase